jgi:hypothetical protein
MKLTKLRSALAFYGSPTKVMIIYYQRRQSPCGVVVDDYRNHITLVPNTVETYTKGPGVGPVNVSSRPATKNGARRK